MLQLEKAYGKNKHAKEFIQELVKGKLDHIEPIQVATLLYMFFVPFTTYQHQLA